MLALFRDGKIHVAANCLRALHEREDSPAADAGYMIIADTLFAMYKRQSE